jgi:RHS repeat-associated protein
VANSIAFTYGTGPDHSLFDVYVGGSLWQSIDGYATERGEATLTIPLRYDGPLDFEIRNREEKNLQSTGYVVRFKQVQATSKLSTHNIAYTYDGLARLLLADYGATQYQYGFDVAGNLVNMNGTSRTFNTANQMTHDGTNALTYDANGNMTNDGVNAYTWDRANRLLSHGGLSYAYDGMGNRVAQDNGTNVTNYLLDTQPSLAKVIGANQERYSHDMHGVHTTRTNANERYWSLPDGLGSIRAEANITGEIVGAQNFDPYGVVQNVSGNLSHDFAFTGEPLDGNGLQYHRARYYDPSLGVFNALDPFEGMHNRPMSLNGYSWVEGNVVNATDPSGLFSCSGETDFPAIQLDCNALDNALQTTNIQIPQIETGVDAEGKIDFEALKNVISTNFGFTIAGFSGSEPILECTEIAQLSGLSRIPSRLSLVRMATALTYIAARFRDAGIGGVSGVQQYLGTGAVVQLVADTRGVAGGGTVGEFTGIVPLRVPGLNVYLGSRIPMFAIVHEMGHLFDKRNDLRPSSVISGLRIGVLRSNPVYGETSLDTTDFFYSSTPSGMEGRANNSANPEEGWADMFMTWAMDGYGISIENIANTLLRPGEIRWRDEASGNNTGLGAVMQLYTLSAVKHLTVGGRTFPSISATDDEKIRYMRPIARVLNPPSGYPSDELEYDQLY